MSVPEDSLRIDESVPTGGVWALPLLALGLGLIACCLVIPATDLNRGLAFERERLRAESDGLERQVAVNDDFLERIHRDPELAERLAGRQSHAATPGVATLVPKTGGAGAGIGDFGMSPFALVRAEPEPRPTLATPPAGGRLAAYCRQPRTRLAVLGIGLFCCLLGLLGGAGGGDKRPSIAA